MFRRIDRLIDQHHAQQNYRIILWNTNVPNCLLFLKFLTLQTNKRTTAQAVYCSDGLEGGTGIAAAARSGIKRGCIENPSKPMRDQHHFLYVIRIEKRNEKQNLIVS